MAWTPYARTVALLAAAGLSPAHADGTRYICSREIVVEFCAVNGAPVTRAELWVTTDGGRNWEVGAVGGGAERSVRYLAPTDGRFGIFIILKNEAGSSGPPLRPGTAPTLTVVVDTVPPLLQIHRAEFVPTPDGSGQVKLNVTLVEENLSEAGLRMFYRTGADAWIDGGQVRLVDRRISWPLPPISRPRLDLRLVAVDLAGNRASDDVLNLEIPGGPEPFDADATPKAGRPLRSPPTASAAEAPEGTPRAYVQPGTVALAAGVGSATTGMSSYATASDAQRMRDLAKHLVQQGSYALAAARLEDALRVAPEQPDLLAELGDVLCRLGRYDAAEARFHAAHRLAPDHAGAIEGLALVATAQRRYPQAREHMLQLQRLLPDSGRVWLHSGDLEHRLGNHAQAIQAWQQALRSGDADPDLLRKVRRRLDCFGHGYSGSATSQPSYETWPLPPRSSSSAEKKSTRSPLR